MKPAIRYGVISIVLLTFAGSAFSGERRDMANDRTDIAYETTGDAAGSARAAAPALSLEQKSRIFTYVMRIPNAPVADIDPVPPASTVPSSVALQDLPPAATQEVPQVKGYKFVKLDDRILLVSPASRVVIDEMPRYKLMD